MTPCPKLAKRRLSILFVGVVAVVTLSASGCDTRSSPGLPQSSHRDSSGVSIVENVAGRWTNAAPWQVSPDPSLVIGEGIGSGSEEAYQFNGIRNALRLSDGRIAIADAGSRQVRIFDKVGNHILTLGGRGKGPGEFVALGRIGALEDGSIGAWDGNLRRLTIFSADGAVAQTTDVSSLGGMEVPALGWFADGSLIVEPSGSPMEIMGLEPGRQRIPERFLHVSRSGVVDTLIELPGREQVIEKGEEEGRVYFQNVLFGRDSHAAVGPQYFYSGDSGVFAIEQRTPAGTLKQIIRITADPRPVTQEELDAAREKDRERQRKMAEQFGGSMPKDPPARDEHPYFDRLIVDRTGALWVRLAEPNTESGPQQWLVFDQQGSWLGRVNTPAGLRITDIDANHLLAVATDDLDIQRVHVYGLNRRVD